MAFPGLAACIAVVSTLYTILALLFILKCVFMARRRSKLSRSFPRSFFFSDSRSSPGVASSPLELDDERSFWTTDVRRPRSAHHYHRYQGFVVGFLGSPTWETTNWARTGARGRRRLGRSSTLYHSRTDSRSQGSRSLYTSVLTSVLTKLSSGSPWTEEDRTDYDFPQGQSNGSKRTWSLRLPVYPSRARMKPWRRFSLPSFSHSDRDDLRPAAETSESNFESIRESKIQLPEIPSVRLVNSDTILPMAYMSSPVSSYQVTFRSGLVLKPTPLLQPPLPTSPSSSENTTPAIHISHPYALGRYPGSPTFEKIEFPTPRPLSLPDSLPDMSSFYRRDSGSRLHVTPTTPLNRQLCGPSVIPPQKMDPLVQAHFSLTDSYSSVALEGGDPDLPHKQLSPVLGSMHHFSPLDVAVPSSKFSPPLYSYPTLPATVLLSQGQQTKKRSKSNQTRVRGSPPIGPSPLRTMTLPNPSSSHSSLRVHVHGDAGKAETAGVLSPSRARVKAVICHEPQSVSRARRLLLRRSLPVVLEEPADEAQTRAVVVRRRHSHTVKQKRDQGGEGEGEGEGEQSDDALHGMIQELARVTVEWDKSIELDEQFRAMVEHMAVSNPPSTTTASEAETETEIEREVDIRLLGLDRFKDLASDPGRDYELEGAREDSAASDLRGFSSFWDESSGEWKRESVGLAW